MSLAASGSKAKAQNTIILGRGNSSPASFNARSTWRCSSAPCSGPKLTTTRSPVSRLPLACTLVVPGNTSSSAKRSICPPLPRMPVFSNSSRQACWRLVWPLRAMLISAKSGPGACPACAGSSSSDSTVGKGTASTVNGPHTRSLALSRSGWSYSVSLSALAAMLRSISACIFCRAVWKAASGSCSSSAQSAGGSNGTSHSCKSCPCRPSTSFWPLRAPSVTG